MWARIYVSPATAAAFRTMCKITKQEPDRLLEELMRSFAAKRKDIEIVEDGKRRT